MTSYLIVGASKGLGAGFAEGLPGPGDTCWMVSRTRPPLADQSGTGGCDWRWIKADAKTPRFADDIAEAVAGQPIDCLIYNAGIWEDGPIAQTSQERVREVITVNLTACILTLKALSGAVAASQVRQIVLIGSTCGLENEGSRKLAYVASKFGVRGVAHALREDLREAGVKVTILSPGSIASDVDYADGVQAALDAHDGARIPVADFVSAVRWLLTLSPAAAPKEIDFPALKDTDV